MHFEARPPGSSASEEIFTRIVERGVQSQGTVRMIPGHTTRTGGAEMVTKETFARLMQKEIAVVAPELVARYEPERFRFALGDTATAGVLNLERAYAAYLDAHASRRREVLQQYATAALMAETPESLVEPSRIMPFVRHRYQFVSMGLDADGPGTWAEFPHEVIGNHLAVGLAGVTGRNLAWISSVALSSLGLDFATALADAIVRLRTCAIDTAEVVPGLYALSLDGTLTPSLVLTPERIRAETGVEDPVVMLPNHSTLLAADPARDGASEMLAAAAEEILGDGGKPLSMHAFRFVQERWTTWLPREPALRDVFARMARAEAAEYANTQAEQAKTHRDIVGGARGRAASVFAVGDRQRTTSVWEPGALVPEVEFVAVTFGERLEVVPWHSVVQHAGHLLERCGCYPERYRVKGGLTEDVLRAFRDVAIPTDQLGREVNAGGFTDYEGTGPH